MSKLDVKAKLGPPDGPFPEYLDIVASGVDRFALLFALMMNLRRDRPSISIGWMNFMTAAPGADATGRLSSQPTFSLRIRLYGKPAELCRARRIANPARLFATPRGELPEATAPKAVRSTTMLSDWRVEIAVVTEDVPGIVAEVTRRVVSVGGSFVFALAETRPDGLRGAPVFHLNCSVVCPTHNSAQTLDQIVRMLAAGETNYRFVRTRVIEPLYDAA